jgi:hypothetical protein
MMKSRESKMLGRVRCWRRKAYEADRAKPFCKRAKEAEEIARRFDLPIIQTHKAGSVHRQ